MVATQGSPGVDLSSSGVVKSDEIFWVYPGIYYQFDVPRKHPKEVPRKHLEALL